MASQHAHSPSFSSCPLLIIRVPTSPTKNILRRIPYLLWLPGDIKKEKNVIKKLHVGTPATMAGTLRPLSGSIVADQLKIPLDHPTLLFLDV